jgi:hypothetical protein
LPIATTSQRSACTNGGAARLERDRALEAVDRAQATICLPSFVSR